MTQTIDVDKIMEEIRAEIRDKGLDRQALEFDEMIAHVEPDAPFNKTELQNQLFLAGGNVCVPPNRELQGGGAVRFLKKCIRKLCRFYVQPIVDDQNQYNINLYRAVEQMRYYINESERKQQELERKINSLEEEIEHLKAGVRP